MPLDVLIVDDSHFFQHRLTEMLNDHPDLNVIGVASNGREAVDKAKELKPDLITMDYEMPVMDGVSAIRQIMADRPVPIMMFSSLTYEGAKTTLDALEAGAVDFLPKNFAEISKNSEALKKKLHNRLLSIAKGASSAASRPKVRLAPAEKPATTKTTSERSTQDVRGKSSLSRDSGSLSKGARTDLSSAQSENYRPARTKPLNKASLKLVAIGASTGGPVALTDVLTKLPSNFPLPIVLTQHMPENFTKAFAERLNRQCQIQVKEAEDGDSLRPGLALLAPGGKQMMIDRRNSVKILPGDDRTNYKPSVDITFGSAANAYGAEVLAIVLTGMGSDGCEGARLLKQRGATIWGQDEASCVIYGMPMAVARANLTDQVLSLKDIGPKLAKELN
ncbi:MAG: chemotaxis response regulator protein-glutamate methylesterase [Candidatus Pelagadaptatus aseana]|uniref:protein-glutamate methylesterase/protein-glutamine glutaminase n=1 Tax=Candidatus Pelagadaptatus aseana TaxID=3120508 RepID=UPI0039B1B661